MTKLLIVEDDELLSKGLAFAMEKEGYEVITTGSYAESQEALASRKVDLVLLDINLPDRSGAVLCEELSINSEVAVIFITANDTQQDIVKGFQLGCDDYITKPFSTEILKQRVKAVLRRTCIAQSKEFFADGNLIIDFSRMSIQKNGILIKLTATELRLLELLVKNRGQVMTRQLLLDKIWDENGNFVDENALSVNIRRLRQKLEDDTQDPQYIITVFGIGYTWGDA